MRTSRVVAAAGFFSLTTLVFPSAAGVLQGAALIRVEQSGIAFAQASIDAQIDECRRMALQEQGNSIAMFNSSATKDKQQFDLWANKTETLIEVMKKTPIPVGKFGDAHVFDSIRRSPARVAMELSADVDAALGAVTLNLKSIETQREATPNDPILYCDYIFVLAHKNVLQHFSRSAGVHKILLDAMEHYFIARITIYSSMSKSKYEKERAEISETLLDLYTQEQRSSDHAHMMLKQLLKQ